MSRDPGPQPSEFWSTSKGRTVEILARDVIEAQDDYGFAESSIDTIAYQFLGGTMVHLRPVASLKSWTRVEFE